MLLQTAFQGQAEIGLTGDNDLHLRTNATATGWTDRLFINRETGHIGIGTNQPNARLSVTATAGSYPLSGIPMVVQHTTPGVALEDTDAPVNQKFWEMYSDGTQLIFRTVNDSYTSEAKWLAVTRTGISVTKVAFPQGDVGIGTAAPSCKLDVAGPVRAGQYTVATLPTASAAGGGAMIYVSNDAGGPVMAYSDGTIWRRVTDRVQIA